ncbi:hypothetical protein ABPG72_001619 [Tetrahymena utriculariae]
MGDDEIEINDLIQLNLLEISDILSKQNIEILKHLGQFSKRFDDKYKVFINESIKNVSKSLEIQSFKFVGQIWKHLFKNVKMMQQQQQTKQLEEQKIQSEENNLIKCAYEAATLDLKEFLKSKKVLDYVNQNQSQNQTLCVTNKFKNEQSPNVNEVQQQQRQLIKNENQQNEEGFYSESTSRRSSIMLNDQSLSFQPDATQMSLKSQLNNSQISQLNQKNQKNENKSNEKIYIVKQKVTLFDESQATQIKNLQKELNFANKKLFDMHQQLLDVTTGYIRDVNHFKDLALGHFKLNSEDFFEVKYFDSTQILDEKLRILLNDKIDDMKRQCQKKLQEIYTKYKTATNELDKLTKCLNTFLGSNNYLQHLKTAFQQQPNDYLLWRAIQDVKGLDFLFNLIENQKPQYGIKYTEIDAFLSKTKASKRQFILFQNILQKQYNELSQNYKAMVQAAESSILDSQNKCLEVDQSLEKSITEAIKQKEEALKQQIEQRLFEEYDQKRMQLYEQFKFDDTSARRMEALERKLAFQKWRFCVQILMNKQISKEKLVNLLNFQNKLKRNILSSIEEVYENNKDANEEQQVNTIQQNIIFRHEWSYEHELEKKELLIMDQKEIIQVLQKKIQYLYEQNKQIASDRFKVLQQKIVLDGKVSLLKLAFKEICKIVKYEYNLQINEASFQSEETKGRVKQFLKDIRYSAEDDQVLIQYQIDSAAQAMSSLVNQKNGYFLNNTTRQVNDIDVQTDVKGINQSLDKLEKEITSLNREFNELQVSNQEFTQCQLENMQKQKSQNQITEKLNEGNTIEILQTSGAKKQNKKIIDLESEQYKMIRQTSQKLQRSGSQSYDEDDDTHYLSQKRIQHRTIEKSSLNHQVKITSPKQNLNHSNSFKQQTQSPIIQMTQFERGVFNRLWNEGNKKKQRLDRLKAEQQKKDFQTWQDTIYSLNQNLSGQNNLLQNQGNEINQQDKQDRQKSDMQQHIQQLQVMNNSGFLNQKMLQQGNTDLKQHIMQQNISGGINVILDSDFIRDYTQNRNYSKTPVNLNSNNQNPNKNSSPFVMANSRSYYYTLKNPAIKTEGDQKSKKQETFIRYFNEENEGHQTILFTKQNKSLQKEQKQIQNQQRSQSTINHNDKSDMIRLRRTNHSKSILPATNQNNSKDKSQINFMVKDGSIQLLPSIDNTHSKSPTMAQNFNQNIQKKRKLNLKQPCSNQNLTFDFSSLRIDLQNNHKLS